MPKAIVTNVETGTTISLEWVEQGGHEFKALIGDREFRFQLNRLGSRRVISLDGRWHIYESVQLGNVVWVWLDGKVRRFERAARTRGGVAASEVSRELAAPMPGNILKIHKTVGEGYRAHEPLIVMESMKMELTLSAPVAGRIIELHCTVGELVPPGKVLATLEPGP